MGQVLRYRVISHEAREIGDEYIDKVEVETNDIQMARVIAKSIADTNADVYGRSYVEIYDTQEDEVIEEVEGRY